MGQLIVLGYPDAAEAEEVRRELVGLQQDHLIALEDAVVVVHHSEGKVELRQALNLTAAGAVSGGFGAPWWACCFSTRWWVRRWALAWVLPPAP